MAILQDGTAPSVVVVTGASAGVGRAIARAFARHGASVALLARGAAGLDGAKRDVESLGGRAFISRCDVSDETQVENAADCIEAELGPIDVWVNNAMVSVFSPVEWLTAEDIRRVTDVTYLGYVWGTLAALRRMKPRDRGVIIQIGSALSHRSIPLQAPYCAAKHAIKGFTESLRTELIHDRSHVRVTQVELPAVNTPQFDWARSRLPRRAQPVPPIFQPEVAAEAVVYASTHPRREILVGWSTIAAIFAEKFVPGAADWFLGRTSYEAQQGEVAPALGRRDNLFTPLDGELGDRGAHGRFDDRARGSSVQLWVNMHRGLVVLGLLTVGSLIGGVMAIRRLRS